MTDTIMLTKNTDQLRQQVAAHVAADSIAQGVYWDEGSSLQMLGTIERDGHYIPEIIDTIRRALEALPE